MTSPNKPAIYQDKEIRIGSYVVALLDVLNQKEAIRALDKLPETDDERTAYVNKLKSSIGTRNAVRGWVMQFLESFDKAPPGPAVGLLNSEQRKIYDRAKQHCVGKYLFSDSIVVYSPLVNESGNPSIRGIYATLAACACTMMNCLAAQVPIRGAIEVGVGVPWDNDEIYGPALLSAYELEQAVAQWPRVVVGRELVRCVSEFAKVPGVSVGTMMQAALAEATQLLISKDVDSRSIVDYLGQGMRKLLHDPIWVGLVSQGRAFVASEHDRFIREGNTKLASRYDQVKTYFDSRAAVWR